MIFPNELILEILQHLNKAQLKRVRLVSKLWSGCASEYLYVFLVLISPRLSYVLGHTPLVYVKAFDPMRQARLTPKSYYSFAKLFISSHQLDLQIFTAVAQDPVLSRCVKEVEYDAIHFAPHITLSDYLNLLWLQTYEITASKGVFKNSDPQICRFIAIRKASNKNGCVYGLRTTEDEAQVRDFTFIQEGYQKWMDEATVETRCSEETTFLRTLIFGLKQLGRLKTVKLRDSWPSDAKLNGEGSPLARSWSPFHTYPRDWTLDHSGHRIQSRASEDFWTLAFALSKAGRTGIRKLSLETIRTPSLLAIGSGDKKKTCVDSGLAAYHTLEDMKLSFVGLPNDTGYNLPILQRMLESMTALKRLELEFHASYTIYQDISFSHAMVFPEKGHWPQVTTFTINGLAIGTKDLLTLLTTKMPSLRHLTFGNISLLDGQWEGVVEYLRVSDRLSTFHIASGAVLNNHEERDYLLDGSEAQSSRNFYTSYVKFKGSIEEYVANWRHNPTLRHPSLMPGVPAEFSVHYLNGIFRLCGMDATGDTLDGLAKHMVAEVARFTGNYANEIR